MLIATSNLWGPITNLLLWIKCLEFIIFLYKQFSCLKVFINVLSDVVLWTSSHALQPEHIRILVCILSHTVSSHRSWIIYIILQYRSTSHWQLPALQANRSGTLQRYIRLLGQAIFSLCFGKTQPSQNTPGETNILKSRASLQI